VSILGESLCIIYKSFKRRALAIIFWWKSVNQKWRLGRHLTDYTESERKENEKFKKKKIQPRKIIRDLKLRPLANDARNKDTVSGQVFGNAVFFFVTPSTSLPAATRRACVRRTDNKKGDCILFIYLFSFSARKLLPVQLLMDIGNERDSGWSYVSDFTIGSSGQ